MADLTEGLPMLDEALKPEFWLVWKSWARVFVGCMLHDRDLDIDLNEYAWRLIPDEELDDGVEEWVIRALASHVPGINYYRLYSSDSTLIGRELAAASPDLSSRSGAVSVPLETDKRASWRTAFTSIPNRFPSEVRSFGYWLCETTNEDH